MLCSDTYIFFMRKNIDNYCGEKVASHFEGTDYHYLCFKKNGSGELDRVRVSRMDYEYYKDGDVIDCNKK